jgi:hypothetical protein
MSNFYTTGGGRQSFDDDAVDRASNSTGGRQPLTGGRGGRGKSAQQQSYSGSGYGGGYSAGGYNDSYMQQDVRDQGFDVRADFDGDGPRWSEVYGVAKQETYRPVYDHDIDFEEESSQMGGTDRKGPHFNEQHRDTEMVSVPVLGPE